MAFPLLSLIPAVERIIDRIIPDSEKAAEAKIKLLELEQSGELAKLTASTELAKGQMEINKIEAGSDDKFSRRWRPFIGWVCGVAFAYNLVLQPFMSFILVAAGVELNAKDLPALDGDLLGWALGGILGLGTLRSVERVKGAS